MNKKFAGGKGRRKKNGARRPVSEEFYAGIERRIGVTVSYLDDPSEQAAKSLRHVDDYLAAGREPTLADGLDSILIFKMIQPELDKAKERSARARAAAERRRHVRELQRAEAERLLLRLWKWQKMTRPQLRLWLRSRMCLPWRQGCALCLPAAEGQRAVNFLPFQL